ncbi:Hypothetical protein CAP_4584 [Chondromyces apiculatus DSM 436]|uniref:Uncharacterized protein n=1 Tax=Chondromyces apiculatus DSM 436 TaxID=1192034 RepID=A0A017T694_9BACT|nr:Hypothetical protein CAP_4584 [Chondromyces apiculatus DSM 436]
MRLRGHGRLRGDGRRGDGRRGDGRRGDGRLLVHAGGPSALCARASR